MQCSKLVLALCLASATAFAPPKAPTAATASTSSLEATVVDIGNENEFAEFGGQMWDPIGLSDLGSESTLKWFRACEVKHSRVAMLATLGWVHQSFGCFGGGLYFPTAPGTLSQLSTKPLEANAQVWDMGILPYLQIFLTIGILELMTEATVKPHYMSSEGDGWINIFGVSNSKGGAELASLKAKEIKNGRLAMIGIASFYCSAVIPGSVPGLSGMNM